MDTLPIIKGLATYVLSPDGRLRSLLARPATQGGTWSASYCYGVWFKHLALLHEQGMPSPPGRIAEFGPGESLGVGIAALLSGARSYGAFDVQRFAQTRSNLELLSDLGKMFEEPAPLPATGWPSFAHLLGVDRTPGPPLINALGDHSAQRDRVMAIREALAALDTPRTDGGMMEYRAPWERGLPPPQEPYDLILSHSVLQYLENLPRFYAVCRDWLRPGGWMSHQVDLSSMQITRQWNGHWSYPRWVWQLVRGNRSFFPTRRTASEHLAAMEAGGFEIVKALRHHRVDGIARTALAADRSGFSDDDLSCSGLFVIARKR